MRNLPFVCLAALALSTISACATDDASSATPDPEDGEGYDGVGYDQDHPDGNLDDGKSDAPRYAMPTDLPVLVSPEIIVSLDGLTVHVFDRATGYQLVMPAGVGEKDSHGTSITPLGHFATGSMMEDQAWWYAPRRTVPAYFAGLPFLRLTARNEDGANTYALHGPITATLIRGFVSHGCVRMAAKDIIRVFWSVRTHYSTPVTIQREVERDAAGHKIDVGRTPTLWAADATVTYGASVGPRH
jgi:hypothetical protein